MTRKILVTGATGFVGVHLLEALDKPGNEIFGASYPQEPEALGLSCPNQICFLDIRKADRVAELVSRTRPDWVFHLAAVSNVGHTWDKRAETLETNLLGTLNLLEALRAEAPRARILFASTSNVYAEEVANRRNLQEADPIQALSPYAFSKISAEQLCSFYSEVEGLDILISRAFPHTGPGQSPNFVCSDWARQVVLIEKGRQAPEIAVGNLEVARDFSDVRDVVGAYILLLEKGGPGEIYNVSSGRARALQEILDQLLSRISRPVRIRIDPLKLRKTDISRLSGDSRKLARATDWEPAFLWEQTLSDLVDYWRQEL